MANPDTRFANMVVKSGGVTNSSAEKARMAINDSPDYRTELADLVLDWSLGNRIGDDEVRSILGLRV